MKCRYCDAINPDDATNCIICGGYLTVKQYPPQQQYLPQPQQYPPPQYPPQYQPPEPKKNLMVIAIVVIVVVIVIISVIGISLYVFREGVVLKIVDVDTEGGYLLLTLRNEGGGTASGPYITIICNDEEERSWLGGDIGPGQTKKDRIWITSYGFYFITSVKVYYNGQLEDSWG
ncbi:MAG: hypothetical protein AB1779_10555 [Candidatus Thermoplasmatota archaeon]